MAEYGGLCRANVSYIDHSQWGLMRLLDIEADGILGYTAALHHIGRGWMLALAVGLAVGVIIILANAKQASQPPSAAAGQDGRPRFDRKNAVHRLAVILMILQTAAVAGRLATADSLDFGYGAADAWMNLVFGAAMHAALAMLGAGWLVRRNLRQVFQRLGLRLPQRRDWTAGLAMAIGLYVMAWAASAVWVEMTAADTWQRQTAAARQLFEAYSSSLILAVVFALLTAISEEMLFRGALQPIFGLWISSLLFTWSHIQYALTPAALILLAVSLGFGWLRRHISATAAVIAHGVYNFIPFLAAALLAGRA